MTPMQPGAPQKSNTSTVLLVVLAVGGLSAVCCVGTLAAIAVPNFIKFNAKAKHSEVKTNLRMLFTAEKSWWAERDTYSESIEEIDAFPERGNRYRYFLTASADPLTPGSPDGGMHAGVAVDPRTSPPSDSVFRAAIPPALLAELGVHGRCPDACQITMVAVGNLDTDSTMDVWSVSTLDRTFGGESVRAGTPYNHVDDTRD